MYINHNNYINSQSLHKGGYLFHLILDFYLKTFIIYPSYKNLYIIYTFARKILTKDKNINTNIYELNIYIKLYMYEIIHFTCKSVYVISVTFVKINLLYKIKILLDKYYKMICRTIFR